MFRRRAMLALVVSAVPVFWGCTPQPSASATLRRDPPGDIVLPLDTRTVESVVPRDATLETLFRANGLPQAQALSMVDVIRPVFSPKRLRAHQPYRLIFGLDDVLRRFEYEIDGDQLLRVVAARSESNAGDVYEARVVTYRQETALVSLRAEIDTDHPSVIAALDEAGEGVELAVTLSQVLSGEVDFNTELRVGDRLDLLFERKLRDGRPAGYGNVVAAELYNDGRVVRAFRFVDPEGQVGYYDSEGRSLRRMFLKSPLPFAPTVTSGFALRRLHPVHRIYRAHLGVDYRARTGTPVVAVANGVVVFAGFSGESGRMVRLRHTGGYETYYLHLSALGPGIRAGARVSQGDLIGRVGMTGTANAPHLDYRVRKGGVFVNPLTVHRNMPPGKPIEARHLDAFRQVRARAEWQLLGLSADTEPPAVKASQ